MNRKLIFCLYLVTVLLTTSMAAAQEHRPIFDVPRLEGISIDGSSEDWGQSGFRVEIMTGLAGQILPADDLDAGFRLGWNESGLLVLVAVQDDAASEDEASLFEKDSVEMFVTEHTGSKNSYQLVIASGADPEYGKLRHSFHDYRSDKESRPELTAEVKSEVAGKGYVIEALLPWQNLGVTVDTGSELGFQLYVNDSDASLGETAGFRVIWYPAEDSYRNSMSMHRIRLVEEPSPPVLARAGSRLEPTRGRATIMIHATSDLIGKRVVVRDGETAVRDGDLMEQAGRAGVEFQIPMPRIGQKWGSIVAVVDDEHVLPVALADADRSRARAMIDHQFVFQQYCFAGPDLPAGDFEHPLQAENLIGPYTTSIKYYDADFHPVKTAENPGRYGAAVEIKPENGRTFRRFRTLFRLPEFVPWWRIDVEASIEFPPQLGIDTAVVERYSRPIKDYLKLLFSGSFQRYPESAMLMSGLHEARSDGVWAADRQWWVTLKRKLYGTETDFPDAFVCPRPMEGEPAPVIRDGTPDEAGMKADALEKIEAVCQEWAANSDQSFAVCLVRHGVCFLHKAYGTRDGRPMAVTDKSWMASITKLMSGTLMMMLVDQGLVDLDNQIDKYLPAFRDIEIDRPMTICHLYTHTNGLWGHWGDEMSDFEEVIACYYPYLDIGKRHEYNGAGYGLGGKIIEMVTGEAIPQFYRRHLLGPLGCENTDVIGTYGDAMSVPLDMAKIGQMLLNRGAYGDMRFFSPETFEKMLPFPIAELCEEGGPETWGIGTTWSGMGFSDRAFGHGAASAATFVVDPENDLVLVMTRQEAGSNFQQYHPKFIQAVIAGLSKANTTD